MKLTSELSATISQVSALTLEAASAKKREFELKTQLDSLLSSEQQLRTELSSVKVQNAGACACAHTVCDVMSRVFF